MQSPTDAPPTPGGLHRLAHWHEDVAVVAFWRAWLGWALRWLTPRRRRTILAAGAVGFGIYYPFRAMTKAGLRDPSDPASWLATALVIGALFGVLWAYYRAAVSFARLPGWVRRHPQVSLHLSFWAFLSLLWLALPAAGITRTIGLGIAIVIPFLIWRLGYLLLSAQRGRMAGTGFGDHLMYLWPAYGGTETPYGKGLDYLSRNEARHEEALARSQLAGIKLFVLAGLWSLLLDLMSTLVYGDLNGPLGDVLGGFHLGVPRLNHLLQQSGGASPGLAWASIYCELIWQVLRLAVRGHVIIGTLRLFGFNVFRNTYKPLLATTILEFWNRYFYYFKELLVEFFFMPVFAKWFRQRAALRMFAAVFAAAFVGNMYYHLLDLGEALALADFDTLWATLQSRLLYCFLLALGIFVSMRRTQRQVRKAFLPALPQQIVRLWLVWTFYAVIHIWAQKTAASFVQRTEFFASLFGIT